MGTGQRGCASKRVKLVLSVFLFFLLLFFYYGCPQVAYNLLVKKVDNPPPYAKQRNHSKVAEWYLQAKANGNTKTKWLSNENNLKKFDLYCMQIATCTWVVNSHNLRMEREIGKSVSPSAVKGQKQMMSVLIAKLFPSQSTVLDVSIHWNSIRTHCFTWLRIRYVWVMSLWIQLQSIKNPVKCG